MIFSPISSRLSPDPGLSMRTQGSRTPVCEAERNRPVLTRDEAGLPSTSGSGDKLNRPSPADGRNQPKSDAEVSSSGATRVDRGRRDRSGETHEGQATRQRRPPRIGPVPPAPACGSADDRARTFDPLPVDLRARVPAAGEAGQACSGLAARGGATVGRRKSACGPSAGPGKSETESARVLWLRSTRIVAAAFRVTRSPWTFSGLESPSEPESQAASSGVDVGRSAKITLRLAPPVARKMAAQARAAGLSHGVYLSTLIAGAPAVLTGADHRRAVAALTASNDEIARMATDLQGLVRLLRQRRGAFGRRGGSDLGGAVVGGPCAISDMHHGSSPTWLRSRRWAVRSRRRKRAQEGPSGDRPERRRRPGRVGRAPVLSVQPDRRFARGPPAIRRGRARSGDPRPHPGDRRQACPAGHGQGHRRRAGHGCHCRALPLHRQGRQAPLRGRPRRRQRRKGGAARPGLAVAVRWLVHRRDESSARGLQHHAVDAERGGRR